MRTMYIILASVGWAWFVIAAGFWLYRAWPRLAEQPRGRGFPIEPIPSQSSTEADRDA
jgi:hypothetical protein